MKETKLKELIAKSDAEIEEYLLFVEVQEFVQHVKDLIQTPNEIVNDVIDLNPKESKPNIYNTGINPHTAKYGI